MEFPTQRRFSDRQRAALLGEWKREVWYRLFDAFNYDNQWNTPERRRELVETLVAACNSEPPELADIAAAERLRIMAAVRCAPPSDFAQPRPVIAFLDRVFADAPVDTHQAQDTVAQHRQSS